jgi:hypothetical protein
LKIGDLCPECGEAAMVNEEGCTGRNVSMEVRQVHQEFRVDCSCLGRLDPSGMAVDLSRQP